MVLIHYKKTEFNQFLHETSNETNIEQVIADLVEINNLRIVLDRLAVSVEDLATHGVMKPEELRGLSDAETWNSAMELYPPEKKQQWNPKPQVKPGQRYNEDKTAYRYGIILGEETTNTIINAANQAKEVISKKNVENKVVLKVETLKEQVNLLRGAVMIGYPGYHGLPEWEPARLILENQFDFTDREFDIGDYLDIKNASLWWAGKELLRGKLLKEYTGKNEKTKIIVKLQKAGSGAPVREPAIDQETHKKMLAYYYKKQEEQKKLEEDDEDQYMNSAWANPKMLKNQLHGVNSDIAWKVGKK
ncbi:hypothetical protein ABPG72_003711 [Tetrahymena utriculariae]